MRNRVLFFSWVMLGVAGVCFGDGALPFTVSKETTDIVAPLQEDGTPDYMMALNELLGKGVTADNNAFVAWLKVVGTGAIHPKKREEILKLAGAAGLDVPGGETRARMRGSDAQREEERRLTRNLWSAEDNPEYAKGLERDQKKLDAFKAAFERPRFWEPYVSSSGRTLLNEAFVNRDSIAGMATQLLARATLRAKGGDFAGFLSDVIAVKRIGRLVATGTRLQDGMYLDGMASRTIGAVVGQGLFGAEDCRRLLKELDGLPANSVQANAMLRQRWMMLDAAIQLSLGKPEKLQLLHEGGWKDVDRTLPEWDKVLREINEVYDELNVALKTAKLEGMMDATWAVGRKHWGEKEDKGGLVPRMDETKEAYGRRIAERLVRSQFGYILGSENMRRQTVMEEEMVRFVMAAAIFRAEKGKWPEKAEELVPGYAKKVPTDIYSESGEDPVDYATRASGVVVTSIGTKIGGKEGAWIRATVEVGTN